MNLGEARCTIAFLSFCMLLPLSLCATAAPHAFIKGDLISTVGSFTIQWRKDAKLLSIQHEAYPVAPVFDNAPNLPFLSVKCVPGNTTAFTNPNTESLESTDILVKSVNEGMKKVVLKGVLLGSSQDKIAEFRVQFKHAGGSKLDFCVEWKPVVDCEGAWEALRIQFRAFEDEYFYGLGQTSTGFVLNGERLPVVASEDAVGRYEDPLTTLTGLETSGDDQSRLPTRVPIVHSTFNRSFGLRDMPLSLFDFTSSHPKPAETCPRCCPDTAHTTADNNAPPSRSVAIDMKCPMVKNGYFRACGWMAQLSNAEEVVKAAREGVKVEPLPDWMHHSGVIVSVGGGTARVKALYERLAERGVPIGTLLIQDWSGVVTRDGHRYPFQGLEWDKFHYPDFQAFVKEVRLKGIHVLLPVNPNLSTPSPESTSAVFEAAERLGYFIKTQDNHTYIQKSPRAGIEYATVDLTNPMAGEFFAQTIATNVLDLGVSGFLFDAQAAIPLDAVMHSGDTPNEVANAYPDLWTNVSDRAVEMAGKEKQPLLISNSAGLSTLLRVGDGVSSWKQIELNLAGLLSGGSLGQGKMHFDERVLNGSAGGLHETSAELVLRSVELVAMSQPVVVMDLCWNPQLALHVEREILGDEQTTRTFKRLTELHLAWAPYRDILNEQLEAQGLPFVRHPLYYHPNDPHVAGLKSQYMLGRAMVVCPVLNENRDSVDCYLHGQGKWKLIWSGPNDWAIEVKSAGVWVEVDAPVGCPAVFVREEAEKAISGAIEATLEAVRKLNADGLCKANTKILDCEGGEADGVHDEL